MTNFERQYWEIKMMNWDTVLFFKKGKFYELYERDADIGCQSFDLKMTDSARSSMRMVGIPEQNFNLWAARFIGAGHKVGRVEQMQTRGQLDRSGSTQTVVPRELTQLLTLGTLTELEMLMDHKPNYLVAIKEVSSSYGVVVADTSRGVFRLAYFGEDDTRSSLVTLLHSTKPKEIVMERGRLSKVALACIDKELGSKVRKTVLTPGTEYPDKAKAIEYFEEAEFFPTKPVTGELASFWDNELVMSAFGAMAFYLRDSKQDKELLSMNNFGKYDPAHGGAALVLDGTTLANLEILESATGRGAKGTLLAHVNHAESAAGKRLLHDWICTPLRDVDAITMRQGAVEELVKAPERRQRLQRFLARLPDLERNLSRLGIACRERDVAWVDPVAYNKKIVELFTRTLTSLRDIHVFVTGLVGDACTSELLKSLLTFKKQGGCFPHFIDVLDAFEGSFDHAAAMESGEVIPNSGKHEEYDRCVAQIAGTNEQLNAMLKDVRKHYKDPKIKWADFGKERYLVEVPTATVNATKVYPSLELKSANKQVTRFFFNRPDARKLIDKALSLKDEEDAVKRRVLKDVLSQFGENAALWKATVSILANVDCLCSLAQASSVPGWTKPVVRVRAEGEKPSFTALGVTHPLVRPAVGARIDTIVANDMCLGGDEPPVSLITGPNMGGKSTAMRSACVVIILAQMGCYVPCQSLDMTAVDRIFTRIGACDRILSGLSTFMVEMREVCDEWLFSRVALLRRSVSHRPSHTTDVVHLEVGDAGQLRRAGRVGSRHGDRRRLLDCPRGAAGHCAEVCKRRAVHAIAHVPAPQVEVPHNVLHSLPLPLPRCADNGDG